MKSIFLLSCLLLPMLALSITVDPSQILLNEWPTILAHDTATGYLKPTNFIADVVYEWTKTQYGTFTDQLNCGARGFDLRLTVANNDILIFHHGGIDISLTAEDGIKEILAWVNKNSAEEDMVFLLVDDCSGQNCMQLAKQLFTNLGIQFIVDDCTTLKGLTLQKALDQSKLTSGGYVMASLNCQHSNYDVTITCDGFKSSQDKAFSMKIDQCFPKKHESIKKLTAEEHVQLQTCIDEIKSDIFQDLTYMDFPYYCYSEGIDNSYPLQRMVNYLNQTSVSSDTSDGQFWQLQALWQETAETVILGSVMISSLIDDESRSNLNQICIDNINNGYFPKINMFEINNVCHGGQELLQALRNRVSINKIKTSYQ